MRDYTRCIKCRKSRYKLPKLARPNYSVLILKIKLLLSSLHTNLI